jgi:hypothetical protein
MRDNNHGLGSRGERTVFKCLCGAFLEWVEKGKKARCPREDIEYIF